MAETKFKEKTIPVQEGYIQFHGYKTWYRVVGNHDAVGKYPLICIHGGPGVPHDYLKSLEAVAKTGRRVIFYDQLGCGNSDRPSDDTLWDINLFKDELAALIKELKIEKYHLLGQSWGGILALEHALDHHKGLQSLILASTAASAIQWESEAKCLRSQLPQITQDILDKHEAAGTTQSSEYNEAVMKFYQLHVCRLNPWPEDFNQAFAKMSLPIYLKMWGPNEFSVTGTIRDWDVRNRLTEITLPTLITSGRYDESTQAINQTLKDGIIHSQWVLFEKSAHLSHLEEPERYLDILTVFLEGVEQAKISSTHL